MSVAYAELAPEVKMTLGVNYLMRSTDKADQPDQNGFLDTELARVQLKSKEPRSSRYYPLVGEQVTKRVRHEDDKV